LKYDFKSDWKEHVKNELLSLGFKYDDNKNVTDNSINLFNISRRLPKKISRKVVFSKEFSCPAENVMCAAKNAAGLALSCASCHPHTKTLGVY
jgi:hypothetical protein